VINWVQVVLSGPYHLHEEIETDVYLDLTVDLSALLTDPVQDWKTKLPYHSWIASSLWIEGMTAPPWEEDWDPSWDPYCRSTCDGYECFETVNIDHIIWYDYEERIDDSPVVLLNGPGGDIIDPNQEFPYFPDYTFGGLFPLMDRDAWLDIFALFDNE
jgi:hypothetical protein